MDTKKQLLIRLPTRPRCTDQTDGPLQMWGFISLLVPAHVQPKARSASLACCRAEPERAASQAPCLLTYAWLSEGDCGVLAAPKNRWMRKSCRSSRLMRVAVIGVTSARHRESARAGMHMNYSEKRMIWHQQALNISGRLCVADSFHLKSLHI